MAPMTMNQVIVRRTDIVANDLSSNEMVMLDVERGTYFGLDGVGKFIWTELAEPTTVEAICHNVAHACDVDVDTCRDDVIEFLAQLLDQHLIDVDPAPPTS